MKKNKKLTTVMSIVLLIALLLVGCNSTPAPSETNDTPKDTESQDTETQDEVLEPITFKFVGNDGSALVTEACKMMAESIEEKSDGAITVELYLEGQLGDNDEDLCTGLSEGNYEMLVNAEMLFNWAVPEWMGLFNLTFAFRDSEHLEHFWASDLGAELNSTLSEKYGVSAYLGSIALRGPRYLTSNYPAYSMDDLEGLKLRTPNNPGVIASWTAAGANVTPIPWGELFGALQTGIVDAQENPLANIDTAGMYQVQKYLIQTEHQYTNFFIYMNDTWYDGVPEEYKAIIEESIDEAFAWHNEQVEAEDEKFLEEFQEKGMILITKDEFDIEGFVEVVIPKVLEEYKDEYAEGGWEKIQAIQ